MAIIADIIASVEPQQIGDFAFGIDANSLRALEFFDDGVAQRFRAPGDRVLIDVVGDGLAGGFLDFCGRGEIRESLREIDGVVLQRQARHFADDGLGELLGFGRKHAAGELRHRRVCSHGREKV